jgi:protein-S-isoprenylcysteine O-methyltransferase Ste14
VLPTSHLVVTDFYRYVRNPMYVGVGTAILGQGLLFGDKDTACIRRAGVGGISPFVFFYEEPTLRHTFGEEYEIFCRNVPRRIPRLRSWREARNSS